MKEYAVIYEKGETTWGAHVPDLPICVAVGKTYEEVQASIKTAIELYIESLTEDGLSAPEPITRAAMIPVAA